MKRENIGGGSTAIAALFINNKLFVANAGDSRAVMGDGSVAVRCSTDHKPDNPEEEERIAKSGGVVVKTFNKFGNTIARVNGQLAVSRALGDHTFKPHVTSEPEVKEFVITPQHRILVMACDGLWDVIGDQEALDIASSEEDPSQAAIKLRDTAYNRGSGDNISVVVIQIPSTYGTQLSNQGNK
jgi:serine/threonine protein phosphatase PrpC